MDIQQQQAAEDQGTYEERQKAMRDQETRDREILNEGRIDWQGLIRSFGRALDMILSAFKGHPSRDVKNAAWYGEKMDPADVTEDMIPEPRGADWLDNAPRTVTHSGRNRSADRLAEMKGITRDGFNRRSGQTTQDSAAPENNAAPTVTPTGPGSN